MDADPRTTIAAAELEHFGAFALALADEARRHLLAFCDSGFEATRKPDGSYVTNADLHIEKQLRAMVEREFPAHGIVGEELPPRLPAAAYQWIFDPIDGTEDFVQQIPTFGTIIGLHYRGEPVAGVIDVPRLHTRGHAVFGRGCFIDGRRVQLAEFAPDTPAEHVRLMLAARANFARQSARGGAAFDAVTRDFPNHRIYRTCYAHLCTVSGQVDAMIEYGNKIWDLAAARILIEEAGGSYREVARRETPAGALLGAVFGRPALVARLADMLKRLDA